MPKRTLATAKFSKAQLDARYWEGWRAYGEKFHWDDCIGYTTAGVLMLIAVGFGVFLIGWGAYSFIHWASDAEARHRTVYEFCTQNEKGETMNCQQRDF